MQMPYRHFIHVNDVYRYGFNGKENDNDVKGEGNQQDYGMRIYDPRLERFLSEDPLTTSYPNLTPYQFASNSPIAGIDMDGGEFKVYHLINVEENGQTKLKVGDYRGASDIQLIVTAKISTTIDLSIPKGPGKMPVTVTENVSLDFNYSEVGITADVVDVNGTLRVLPQGVDWNNLPSLEDPIWESFETTDEFRERIVTNGNKIAAAITDGVLWLRLRSAIAKGNKPGQSLGVKQVKIESVEKRLRNLKKLAEGWRPSRWRVGVVKKVWETALKKIKEELRILRLVR